MPTHRISNFVLAVLLASSASPITRAQVVSVGHYKLGDSDPGAIVGQMTNPLTEDVSGGHRDLQRVGAPTYDADVSLHSLFSSVSARFDGLQDAFRYSGPLTAQTEDVGVEAWVKPDLSVGSGTTRVIAYTGFTCCTGFGILIDGSDQYIGLIGGVTILNSGVTATERWTHVALVREGHDTTLYVDGCPLVSATIGVHAPGNDFSIGAWSWAGTTAERFAGCIDEVRYFSFAPETFDTAELLVRPGQPNSPQASLSWGVPPTCGLWPRRTGLIGTTATLVVSGAPFQPYALAQSVALSPATDFTPFGNMDVDLASLRLLMDGVSFSTGTFFDPLANTGATGTSTWTLPVPAALATPSTSLGAFQALVGDPSSAFGFTLSGASSVVVTQ